MIDFLSGSEWISPQIDFLLFLQNIRITYPDFIDKFFLTITIFGEFWLPTLICAIVYWCIDFKIGIYLFSLECFNIFIAHFAKMLAEVYRPWVLDSRIQPSKLAIPFAKGYSFPSGHSAMSSSILGGIAYTKKHKIISTLLICLILLIGFSRLWLGVHTPQDVVCGLAIGLILVFVSNKIINWAEKNDKRYIYLLGVINTLAILALVYVAHFNTYRMDYVGNQLLVDPQKQIYITITAYSLGLGLINGCFLCRKFFPFDPRKVSLKRRITRGIVGFVLTFIMLKFGFEPVIMNNVSIKFLIPFIFTLGMVITLIYPIIFTKLGKFFK